MQAQDLHPTDQRIGQPGHQQHVGRARQQEASRRALSVHRRLDRREQAGGSLHLIEDGVLRQIRHKPNRVGLGRCHGDIVVEADVGVAGCIPHLAREGGLAALARPVDEHDGGIGQRVLQAGERKTRVEHGVSHRGTVYTRGPAK